MLASSRFHFDASVGISQGQRERQEDAIAADFPVGSGFGFAVLADGMGGHAAGDIASHVVVTEVFSELKLQSNDRKAMEAEISGRLRAAVEDANACLAHISQTPSEDTVMGTTVVAPVLFEDRLYWVSVGDSALWLYRDGELQRLNEDHSMAPQIDAMYGDAPEEKARALSHPDRNCLTSVLIGKDIPKVDCSDSPVRLRDNDTLIVASDGLEFLPTADISAVLEQNAASHSSVVSQALLRAIMDLEDPEQDNVALCVIRVHDSKAAQQPECTRNAKPKQRVTLLARNGSSDAVICISKQASV